MLRRIVAVQECITSDGDTWASIAKEFYGTEEMGTYILEFNPEHAGTLIFSAGTILRLPIPDVIKEERKTAPWKRKNAGTS